MAGYVTGSSHVGLKILAGWLYHEALEQPCRVYFCDTVRITSFREITNELKNSSASFKLHVNALLQLGDELVSLGQSADGVHRILTGEATSVEVDGVLEFPGIRLTKLDVPFLSPHQVDLVLTYSALVRAGALDPSYAHVRAGA